MLTQESEALAGDDLNASIAWRGVRAEVLARRGEHAAAIELARAVVEIAAPTDALLHHANARVALAAALRAAGQHAEAEVEQARAIELWEAKGATLLVERARDRAAPPERALEVPPRRAGRRVRANAATANVHEPLATLGESLAVCRREGERDDLALIEVDANGRSVREEVFGAGRLGDALARLYERHAEQLPDGPQRARAAGTAHTIAACWTDRPRALRRRVRERGRDVSTAGPSASAACAARRR